MLSLPARPSCPGASACLRARVSSPGWQTGACLKVRWPSPVGRGTEWAVPPLVKTLSSSVRAAGLEQTRPMLLTSPHPTSKCLG